MKLGPRTIYVDSIGNASDGTNMWDWDTDRLINILDCCWSKEVADLAARILKNKKERLDKIFTK